MYAYITYMYSYVVAWVCLQDSACLFIILYVYPSVVYDISCCYPLMCTDSHTRVSSYVWVRVWVRVCFSTFRRFRVKS